MSKYQLDNSPIYVDGTDIPKNKLEISDSELIHEIELNLLTEAYEQFSSQLNNKTTLIKASIECVQYADSSKLEKIIFNGLEKRSLL